MEGEQRRWRESRDDGGSRGEGGRIMVREGEMVLGRDVRRVEEARVVERGNDGLRDR